MVLCKKPGRFNFPGFDYNCVVNGPSQKHAWEISNKSIYGEGVENAGPGWFWVPILHAISISTSEHGYNHWFTENLKRCII